MEPIKLILMVPLKVELSLWNGPIRSWNVDILSIDKNLNPHGLCRLTLPGNWKIRHQYESGKHKFLDWSIKQILGKFIHGKLNGLVIMLTWQTQIIFTTFVDGVMHGPAFVYGTTQIFDPEVKNLNDYFDKFFCLTGSDYPGS